MSDLQKQVDYWTKSAKRDWDTAEFLLKTKRYDACLFFCHLTLEKILKGLVAARTGKPAPFTHDLAKLSIEAHIVLDEEQIKNLRIITGFNIATRYDDAKFSFYKQCTKSYTEKYFNISKNLYLWLKKQFPKK